MKTEIELHKQRVEYVFKQSTRARRIWLTVKCDGTFLVTAPPRMDPQRVASFIHQKADWVLSKIDYFKKNPGVVVKASIKDFKLHKSAALRLARARLEHFNKIYGFTYKKVSIRRQHTRWGSCSREGNLSFNFQIIHLPPHLSDYIIVHEICHLKEFNHSKKFWALVEKAVPNHLQIRKEFKHINLR
jgi:predicted metal-dependent hydrolase